MNMNNTLNEGLNRKKIGIVGGMGPMASCHFLNRIIEKTEAVRDQDHFPIVMESIPQTPDRTAFILGESSLDPYPYIYEAACNLERAGAEVIAIPCVTFCNMYDRLQTEIKIPIINLMGEIVDYFKTTKAKRVGILATDGTIKAGLIQNNLNKHQIDVIIPSIEEQKGVMDVIYKRIKAKNYEVDDILLPIIEKMKKEGADSVLFGCTELSLVYNPRYQGCVDCIEILADSTIEFASSM